MKQLKTLILLGIVCMLSANMAAAAQNGTPAIKLSMKEAVGLALKNNISVLNASEDITRTRGESRAASSVLFPQVNASGSVSRMDNSSGSSYDNEDRAAGAELTYSIYNGGRNQAQSAQGKLNVGQAEDTLHNTREIIALSVWQNYFSVLYCDAVCAAEENALNYYKSAVREMTKRVAVGVSRKLDLSRMQQQYASSFASFVSAKNDYDSAMVALCRVLQISPDTKLQLTDTLREEILNKGGKKEKANLRGYYDEALKRRGDYQNLLKAKKISEKEIVVASSYMKPDLSFSGGYGYTYHDMGSDPLDTNDQWSAKLSLGIPLYDGGYTSGKVMAAKASLKQSENDISDKEEAIKAEITDNNLSVISYFESAVAAKREREYAKESLAYAEVGYREGVNVQLDVIEARTKLTDANKKLAGYLMEFRSAQASYWKSGGELVERIMNDALKEVN